MLPSPTACSLIPPVRVEADRARDGAVVGCGRADLGDAVQRIVLPAHPIPARERDGSVLQVLVAGDAGDGSAHVELAQCAEGRIPNPLARLEDDPAAGEVQAVA